MGTKLLYYRSDNGYAGIITGHKPSMVIKDKCGRTVFHAFRSKVRTMEDLKGFVDNYPYTIAELLRM